MAEFSVALCTYNGSLYLQEQLESISNQILQPAELVVCDDGSEDESGEVIRSFAARSSFPVRFVVNERKLGSTRNFEKAISLCRGDLIALCDQDDVWYPDKLQELGERLRSQPEIGGVFSNAEVTDENLRPLGYTLWDRYRFNTLKKHRFSRGLALEVLLQQNVVTGSTFAFRTEWRPLILPIPGKWMHDAWIALLIAAVTGLSFVDSPLVFYRQHAANQIGGVRPDFPTLWRATFRDNSENYETYHSLLQDAYNRLHERAILSSGGALHLILAKMVHMKTRATMPKRRLARTSRVLRELFAGHYFRYSNGFLSAAKDLFH